MDEGFIFGCSAQGRVALSILRLQHPQTTWFFVDDNPEMLNRSINGAKVIGGLDLLALKTSPRMHIALGNPRVKRKVVARCLQMNIELIQAIHPSAVIAAEARIGQGVSVGAGAVINTDAEIGDFTLINTGVIIEHDSIIGAYSNVSPRACIGGRVIVEEEAFIGSGAIVLARTTVGAGSVVGMGAIVTRNVPSATLVFGVPAREIRKIDESFDWSRVL